MFMISIPIYAHTFIGPTIPLINRYYLRLGDLMWGGGGIATLKTHEIRDKVLRNIS